MKYYILRKLCRKDWIIYCSIKLGNSPRYESEKTVGHCQDNANVAPLVKNGSFKETYVWSEGTMADALKQQKRVRGRFNWHPLKMAETAACIAFKNVHGSFLKFFYFSWDFAALLYFSKVFQLKRAPSKDYTLSKHVWKR